MMQAFSQTVLDDVKRTMDAMAATQFEAAAQAAVAQQASSLVGALSSASDPELIRGIIGRLQALAGDPHAGASHGIIAAGISQGASAIETLKQKEKVEESSAERLVLASATVEHTVHPIDPKTEILANSLVTSHIWTEKQREMFERIDPKQDYDIVQFDKHGHICKDKDGNPIHSKIHGSDLREHLGRLGAYVHKDDPRMPPEAKKDLNKKMHGHEEDAKTNGEKIQDLQFGHESAKVAASAAAANATPEKAKQIEEHAIEATKNAEEATEALTRKDALEKKAEEVKDKAPEFAKALVKEAEIVAKKAEESIQKFKITSQKIEDDAFDPENAPVSATEKPQAMIADQHATIILDKSANQPTIEDVGTLARNNVAQGIVNKTTNTVSFGH